MPADLILLSTSELNDTAYVETSNIDGETNLKVKQAASAELAERCRLAKIGSQGGLLVSEAPNSNIHTFSATLYFDAGTNENPPRSGGQHRRDRSTLSTSFFDVPEGSEGTSVGQAQLLLRGSILRNTRFCVGLVVYTGKESKVAMNSQAHGPAKMSKVEMQTNAAMTLNFVALVLLCVVSTVLRGVSPADKEYPNAWYLGPSQVVIPTWISDFIAFVILYNAFIPLALYVTVEICNFGHAFLIMSDQDLYDPVSDTAAKVRTSKLSQEIGNIEYVFSDKTGTLTENVMTFKRCSIGGTIYGRSTDGLLASEEDGEGGQAQYANEEGVDSVKNGTSENGGPDPNEGREGNGGQMRTNGAMLPSVLRASVRRPDDIIATKSDASSKDASLESRRDLSNTISKAAKQKDPRKKAKEHARYRLMESARVVRKNPHDRRRDNRSMNSVLSQASLMSSSSAATAGLLPNVNKRRHSRNMIRKEAHDLSSDSGFDDPSILWDAIEGGSQARRIKRFLTLLAVCHTVVIERDAEEDDGSTDEDDVVEYNENADSSMGASSSYQSKPKIENNGNGSNVRHVLVQYNAESPDEGALVKAAAKLGFQFIDDVHGNKIIHILDPSSLLIPLAGALDDDEGEGATIPVVSQESMSPRVVKEVEYRVLAVNEFNSTRKRMSVLVQEPGGAFVLYCKGADNVRSLNALDQEERKTFAPIFV